MSFLRRVEKIKYIPPQENKYSTKTEHPNPYIGCSIEQGQTQDSHLDNKQIFRILVKIVFFQN